MPKACCNKQKHKTNKHRKKTKIVKFKQYIPEHSEFENSNQRDIALLEHGWSPHETKFGEPFKGKNKIIIFDDEK